MDIDEIMRTTWANRRYLPAPVPGEVIYRVLDNARFAPSGGNRETLAMPTWSVGSCELCQPRAEADRQACHGEQPESSRARGDHGSARVAHQAEPGEKP